MPSPAPSCGSGDVALQEAATVFVQELRTRTQSEREIFASLQHELKRIARAKMRRERPDHTLQPTALINEAFIKIHKAGLPGDVLEDTSKALRLIAHAMEQILNDYADAYHARKRGGLEQQRVPLDENQARDFAKGDDVPRIDSGLLVSQRQSEEILDIRESIALLRETAPRQAYIVQMQFYCGLTQQETAELLELSVETIKLETRKAKAFLRTHLARSAE